MPERQLNEQITWNAETAEAAEAAETAIQGFSACSANSAFNVVVFHKAVKGGHDVSSGSGAAGELPGLGVDLDLFALLDEERHVDLQAGLEFGDLGHAAAGRVPARAGLG